MDQVCGPAGCHCELANLTKPDQRPDLLME